MPRKSKKQRVKQQSFNHIPVIRHEIWSFWADLVIIDIIREFLSNAHSSVLLIKFKKFRNQLRWRKPFGCYRIRKRTIDKQTSSATPLIVIRRFLQTIFFGASTLSLVVDMLMRPERAFVLIADLQCATVNISRGLVHLIPFSTQNLYSIFFSPSTLKNVRPFSISKTD